MKGWTLPVSTVMLGLVLSAPTAKAQFFDDPEGWPLFSFHRYGGDVNRPASTPDRPYWHGDDAVPLSLRWHDPEAIVDDVAVAAPVPPPTVAVAAEAAVVVSAPRRRIVHQAMYHRRAKARVAKQECLPAAAKSD